MELSRQQTARYILLGATVFLLLIILLLQNRYRLKTRTAEEIKKKNADLERTTAELQETKDRYQRLFDDPNTAKLLLDLADRTIVHASRAAGPLLGLPARELTGKEVSSIAGEWLHDITDRLSEAGLNSSLGRVEAFQHGNGEVRDFEAWVSSFKLAGRGVALLTFHDVTERRLWAEERVRREERERYIDALEAHYVELEARNAEVERFAYTVSHDLKSPLITIRGLLKILERDALAGNRERMQEGAERVRAASAKMALFLEELQELARAGQIGVQQEVVLSELAHEALGQLAGQGADVDVDVRIDRDLPVILGDRTRLLEVLQNLIENAIKYQGTQPNPRVEISWRRDGAEAVYFVRDNGTGIDPRFHQRVFGLFDRLNPDTSGTGVGLALVKRIIEAHDGRIWVESEGEGHGSGFCFTLGTNTDAPAPPKNCWRHSRKGSPDMTETILVGNGVVVNGLSEPEVTEGAVVWEGERIVAVGPEVDLKSRYPGAAFLDARGGVIMPGLVNLHHHFYSALARGLDPGASMQDFGEVLDRLWWRLDRALDVETVSVSAQLCAADCVRWGNTTVFDHHASPSCVAGSLDAIADAMEQAGLSAVLCYEVTDRNGRAEAAAGIEENLRFLDARCDDPRIRGVFGLHASFTLRDETLEEVVRRRPEGAGCHIHVAEDPVDVAATREVFGVGPVERLERFGLLDAHALLAHGIHLEPGDYETIARHGSIVIHNPESNNNNGVGRLDTVIAAGHGCRVGLGTDGMSSAVQRALRSAFLTHRGATRDPSSGFEVLPDLLVNNVEIAQRFLGEPLLGSLVPGAPADVIVIEAAPPTPIGSENFFGHLIYGLSEAPVRHTVARGRVLLEDFQPTTIDCQALAARARELSPDLWRRFRALSWGTPFLGEN